MFLHKILALQAAFLFIKYKILLENPPKIVISYFFINIMSCIYKYCISYSSRNNVYSDKMFVYELWLRVVDHKMPWSRVACKSVKEYFMEILLIFVFKGFMVKVFYCICQYTH